MSTYHLKGKFFMLFKRFSCLLPRLKRYHAGWGAPDRQTDRQHWSGISKYSMRLWIYEEMRESRIHELTSALRGKLLNKERAWESVWLNPVLNGWLLFVHTCNRCPWLQRWHCTHSIDWVSRMHAVSSSTFMILWNMSGVSLWVVPGMIVLPEFLASQPFYLIKCSWGDQKSSILGSVYQCKWLNYVSQINIPKL